MACNNWHEEYIGKTLKKLNKRLYEHKRDLLQKNTLNSLVAHCNESDHNFNIKNATLIKKQNNSLRQKCIERALIGRSSIVNLHPGSNNILAFLADLLSQFNFGIFNNKGDGNKIKMNLNEIGLII